MTTRAAKPNRFLLLPAAYQYDGQIMQVSAQAELLFIRMIDLSNSVQSYGRLSAAQVQLCARGMRSLRKACAELVQAELISHDVHTTEYHVNDCVRWFLERPNDNVSAYKPEAKPAAQKASKPKVGDPVPPRGGARVKTDRQTDKEEERTPSGSVRSSSAQAAPRVAGGATQPAPDDQDRGDSVDEFAHLSGAAKARAAAAKGIANSSVATGKNTQLFKYPRELNSLSEPAPAVELSGDYR